MTQRPSRRSRWLLLLVPLVVGVGGLLLSVGLIRPEPGVADSSAPGSGVSSDNVPAGPPPRGPARPSAVPAQRPGQAPLSPEEAEREAQRQLWEKRLERARFTLDSYRKSTRYPHESRPIEEHPDLVYPQSPERKQPLSKEQRDVSLTLKQEKVYVVGDEVVRFFVGCENASSHQPLPCEVHSAVAREAPHMAQAGSAAAPVPLDFNDTGRNGDEVAGDGTWTGSFQPSRQGFAMFEGTLRVEFRVRAGNNAEGGAFFDIVFTPAAPATFTGKVREVIEKGSLQLYVGLQVRKPGRYVMAGRVDDEAGIPLAYLEFNEELEAGAREVRFQVFGLLLHDRKPDFPLRLRDVEGFLLREQGDPDRELVKALYGYVHTTQPYTLDRFSEAEWDSEERQRYLAEYGKDVAQAESALDGLSGRPADPKAP
ncbi:MAG TPA: choice-of-anchor X domain-containing protein [Archangium sp.]|uniref:choice-of-anchor X domain-containing protein n=1 Tax=Archangium sp. TaxID=1872627 RepID=UPI002E30AAB5|nr:choice-of-anchor X domain-containing protein [Archangium sp.]HEX5750352.1 choice-of-anchor X domain-containing protein [Archangium sp.]